ncbi:MAG: diguanylate cyclase [Burkholderiaceae bacterium]
MSAPAMPSQFAALALPILLTAIGAAAWCMARRQRDLKRRLAQLEQSVRSGYDRARHDPLTGLMNRSLLAARFRASVPDARRAPHGIVVCYLDLDGFKQINDEHGHAAGDEVLMRISRRIRRCVRATDAVARLGGDEFAILLHGVADPRECLRTVQRLIRAVGAPMRLRRTDAQVRVGASVGIAIFPAHADGLIELLACADRAMYQAKRSGKGRWALYRPEPDAARPPALPAPIDADSRSAGGGA